MCKDGSVNQPGAAGRLPAPCCDWTSLHIAEGGERSWGGRKGQVIQGLASHEKEHDTILSPAGSQGTLRVWNLHRTGLIPNRSLWLPSGEWI